MNQNASFVITPFTNPSGEIVFRVTGWLDGKRVRKNFRSRSEADAERQILEVQCAQGETGIRTTITRLTDEQIGEAETVFARVSGLPHPLAFYVDFALANYREPQVSKLLSEAVTLYSAAKDHEFAQDQISSPQLQRIKRDLKQLQKHFPNISVAELTAERLIGFFNLGKTKKPSLKTYNNRRGIVSTFLKFSFQNGWISENPMAKVPHHRIRRKRGAVATLSAAQAVKLMEHVEGFQGGRYVPFFALCLFGGIRPCLRTGEILRLKPEDINLDTGIIFVSADVSKVREPRKITIQANLAAWLKAYPPSKFPIVPKNLQHVRAKIAKDFGLSHDIMRHTFIYMFVAKFRSIGEAAIQAGNSEAIIRKHYLDMKSQTEAEAFYAIMPQKTAGEEKPKALPAAACPLARRGCRRAPRRAICDTRRSFLRVHQRAESSAAHCVYTGARVWKRNCLHRPSPSSPTSPASAPAGFSRRVASRRFAPYANGPSSDASPTTAVGHFVYFDPAEVALHIGTKLKVAARG